MTSLPVEPPFGMLRWRCRRGMKELDLLLTRYLEERYASAPAQERQAFVELLGLPDPDLYAYFLGRETPPAPALAALIGSMADPAPGRL